MNRLRAWARVATDRSVVSRALATSALVGSILTAINQAGEMAAGRSDPGLAVRIALTFLVPFIVSTVSSVAAIRGQRAGHQREYFLLEREIEAINRFPDQNPNPVLRVTANGRLVYANAASAPITSALGVERGDDLPGDVFAELAAAAAASPVRVVEVRSGLRTFAVLPVAVPEFDFLNLYGTDITAARVVERFPDRNPNPVMRTSGDGALVYANAASTPMVQALALSIGDPLPLDLLERVRRASEQAQQAQQAEQAEPEAIEVQGEGRTYALRPVAIPEFGFTNLYGTDVTATRAITKFPDQNSNSVLRVSRDGKLLYANPAAALVQKAFGAEIGQELTRILCERVVAIAEAASPETLEVEQDGRIFALLVVPVFEFGFINVYGTDITAAREVEEANRENERLLLNILPASIAQRLRQGEMLIADQFDEMTVLFADVVDFTRLSMRLTPTELVTMLNEVFSIFDRLADRYALEKIKTIGDAYMVVGGLASHSTDHAARVGAMGLDMIAEVALFRQRTGRELHIRVGMHVGPAVAGVIGIRKFIYDVWGDTVNTASRMESHGMPGRLLVTEATQERLGHTFLFEPHGTIDVKGKGPTSTYFLVERRATAPRVPVA